MNSPAEQSTAAAALEQLEHSVEALLQLVEQLRAENRRLRTLQAATEAERQRIDELRQQARDRLLALLEKLNNLAADE